LSGGLGEETATAVNTLSFPQLAGVDLNSKFEISPALKDVESLKRFVEKLNLTPKII